MPEREPIGPQAILAKRQQYLIPCSYHFYRDPPQIVRGQGIYVYDSAGRRYMDLYSGVSVHALGHCHPEIVEAICQQVRTLQHTSTIYLTEPPDPHHGRLSCTDCHDPAKPRQHQEEFAAKCATCHNSRYRALFYSWANALDQSSAPIKQSLEHIDDPNDARRLQLEQVLQDAAAAGFHNLNLAQKILRVGVPTPAKEVR